MACWETKARWRAIMKNGDKALTRFFEGLQQRKLIIMHCTSCNASHSPPGSFCPDCLSQETEMVAHSGRGRIYAFTSMAERSHGNGSITFAMVELHGVEGRIFTRIEAPYEEMAVGMEVEADYIEQQGIVLPCFKPVEKGGPGTRSRAGL